MSEFNIMGFRLSNFFLKGKFSLRESKRQKAPANIFASCLLPFAFYHLPLKRELINYSQCSYFEAPPRLHRWRISVILLALVFIVSSCGQPKTRDSKFDDSQYERLDVNFYKGKKDGKIYIRTAALEAVKDSGNKLVYYYKEVKDIDIATYKACEQGGYYAKDKNHVYTWEITSQGQDLVILEGADPVTFQSFAHSWGKDTNGVYFERNKLAHLNPAKLVPVCFESGTDSSSLYIKYIRDESHLYYENTEVKLAPGVDITHLSCKDDLFGNSFLESNGKLYILKNGQMQLYQ